MLNQIFENRKKTARLSGLIYLMLAITGIFSLMYVPSNLFDWISATNTVNNIKESETLFRLGIAARVLSEILFIILPLTLYMLLKGVDKSIALIMVLLVQISVAMDLLNIANLLDVILLISEPKYLTFDSDQINSHVMLLLDSYYNGMSITQIFWGLWLLPFGYLVYKSGFLPKFLGIFLMLGCLGYLIGFVGPLLWKEYYTTIIPKIVVWPARIGELGSMLWLLIMGAKEVNSE